MNPHLKRLTISAVAALALAGTTGAAQAAPGSLDPTFATGGILLTEPGISQIYGVEVQPDGKVLALDSGYDPQAYQRVVRFLPDGTPDPSFGSGGKSDPLVSPGFWVRALGLQPDGKILVAGYDGTGDYALARFTADGKLDADFDGDSGNGNGIVHTPLTGATDTPKAVAVDKQGRIVVAGLAAGHDIGVVRYLADGKLDKTLAGDGKLIDSTPANESVTALATVDNEILVGGAVGPDAFVARYSEQGAVVTGFGTVGRKIFVAGTDEHYSPVSLAVQSDGTIVAGVSINHPTTVVPDRLIALTPGGDFDTGFADGGSTPVAFNIEAIRLAKGDKIVAAGWDIFDGDDALAIDRRNVDGTPDSTFNGGNPVMNRPSQTTFGMADFVAVAPDDKIVAAGKAYSNDPQQADRLVIARYLVDPDPVIGGTTDPGTTTQPTPPTGTVPAPLLLSNVKITSHRRRATLRFRLNRAATVTVRIKRLHHKGHAAKLTRASHAGANRLRFTRRAGRYRATLIAKDPSGARSKARTITFRVARPHFG
jgi:uncharacterized delta-60 repeat protein